MTGTDKIRTRSESHRLNECHCKERCMMQCLKHFLDIQNPFCNLTVGRTFEVTQIKTGTERSSRAANDHRSCPVTAGLVDLICHHLHKLHIQRIRTFRTIQTAQFSDLRPVRHQHTHNFNLVPSLIIPALSYTKIRRIIRVPTNYSGNLIEGISQSNSC